MSRCRPPARSRSRISICVDRAARATSPPPNVKALNAKQEADRRTRITGIDNGLDERLRDMDDMGLDMQLVMPPPPQCYYTVPVEIAREGDARAQRRHRRIRRAQAGPLRRARHRAAAGRQRSREGARALDEAARLQGLPDPHQRGRQGTVRSGVRAVLGQGRGARRAGGDPSERLHAGRALLAATISTT